MLSAALHGGEVKAPPAVPAPEETGETYFGVKLNKAAFPGLFEDDSKPEDYVPGLLEKLSLVDVKMEPFYKVASSVDGKPRADYVPDTFKMSRMERIPSTKGGEAAEAAWKKMGKPSLTRNYLSEKALGSLPKPMTSLQRSSVTPLSTSAVADAIHAVPPEKVAARTPQGRALRRELIKGCTVAFITAGYSGKRFIYERAKELGIRTVVIDGPDSWAREMLEDDTIAKFYPVDFSDEDNVFENVVAACKQAEKDLGALDGVLSFWELAQPIVARVGEALALPGNSAAAVDAARTKQTTRKIMKEAGLPTPANYLIESAADLDEAARVVGFPAVIKPISGAASMGVIRVESEAELAKTYKKAVKEITSVRLDEHGILQQDAVGDDVDDAPDKLEKSIVGTLMLMEQYLDGPEVDVDVVMSQGEAVYGILTDNWPTLEPYFNETGSNCPSILPLQQQKELVALSVAAVKALGFTQGVFHVEGKYTSTNGAQLIEVNARMGGKAIWKINNMVWGIDLVEEQLMTVCGIPTQPLIATKPLANIAEYTVNVHKSGIIENLDFIEKYKSDPNIVYIRPLIEPGSKVVAVEDGLPTWIYDMMVTGPTPEEAISYITKLEEEIRPTVPIKPVPK